MRVRIEHTSLIVDGMAVCQGDRFWIARDNIVATLPQRQTWVRLEFYITIAELERGRMRDNSGPSHIFFV
jgi:hypothetical protein